MFDYLLPLGTVVTLNNASKKIMIIGFLQKDAQGNIFDYTGVTYPEGFIDSRLKIVFNHSAISEVVFRGFDGGDQSEWKAIIKLIEAAQRAKTDRTQIEGK